MSNRVEDLEAEVSDLRTQVSELQATVDGLMDELVDAKERLRQVEDGTEAAVSPIIEQSGDASTEGEGGDAPPAQDEREEAVETVDSEEGTESETEDSDIIVA